MWVLFFWFAAHYLSLVEGFIADPILFWMFVQKSCSTLLNAMEWMLETNV